MSQKGAFVDACEYVINKDLELKKKIIQDIIDNPNNYPPMTGKDMCELIFGDYQRFVDEWRNVK